MQQHQLTQGSAEWLAHRAQCWNASDAPAMMGCSPYETRAALIRRLATGITPDVDAGTQRLYDAGHRFEALARPRAESIVGDDLSPLSGSIDAGLSRPVAASFDGLTFMRDTNWEHKSLNDALRAALPARGIGDATVGAALPLNNRVQLEQQMIVSGAERSLFTASKWDGETLVEERHCWYASDAALRAQILAGWAQLEKDVASFVPEAAAAPAPAGRAPETLPALRIEVTGAVTASNLAEFKQTALTAIRSVNRELKTDTDFADAEKAVKWCGEVETRLKAAKEHALSQTADIDALFKALDDIGAEARSVRLDLDKLVKRRKDEVKEEAVMAARRALAQHIAALDAELFPVRVQPPAVDFALAIKGLRSIASMQDALDTELANGKIAADAQARVIRANRAALEAADAAGLFPDFAQVCTKPADDFANLIASRRAVAEQRLQAERERIRAEEAARLEREQKAREEAAAREAAQAQARADAEQRAAAQREADERSNREAAEAHQRNQAAAEAARAEFAARATAAPTPAPAPEVRTFTPRAAAPAAEEPTLSLGRISGALGFTVTADLLARLGFTAHVVKAARLYRPSQFAAIKRALIEHIEATPDEVPLAA